MKAWHNEGIVEWLGHHSDMPQLIRDSHIFCLPSYYREGVPLALIEAASSGQPIVTTDWPGCREVVRHENNGFLGPVRESAALAEALRGCWKIHRFE